MQPTDFSRRNFLKGGVLTVAGAIASSVFTGCGNGRKHEVNEDGTFKREVEVPDFMKPPAPIPDNQIVGEEEADVVVVGAGMVGLCAAISAAEEGAKVILLEKTNTVNFRGYDYVAVNSCVQKEVGNIIDPVDVTREIMRFGAYKPNQKVVMQWVKHSGHVNDWLLDMALAKGCKIQHVWTRDEMVAEGATLPTRPSMTFVLEPTQEAIEKAPKGMIGGTCRSIIMVSVLQMKICRIRLLQMEFVKNLNIQNGISGIQNGLKKLRRCIRLLVNL